MKTLKFFTAVLFFIGLTTAVQAQQQVVEASATIVSELTVDQPRGLEFGQVIVDNAKTVLPSEATSGRVRVSSGATANIAIAFDLSDLSDGVGGYALTDGANALPITFGSGAAAWSNDDDGTGQTAFDPTSGIQLSPTTATTFYVFIGGTVTASDTQALGTYTGDITISAEYL